MSILYIFSCPLLTSAGELRWRFLLDDFLVKMWRLPGLVRFSLPVPVTLNRAFTDLRVFIFVTTCLLCLLLYPRCNDGG